MIFDHDLGAAFTEAMYHKPESRERAVLAETAKISATGIVAIPSVIFFPDITASLQLLFYHFTGS